MNDAGTHFYDKDYIVTCINEELQSIMEKVFRVIFEAKLMPAVDRLIEFVKKGDGIFYETLYSDGDPRAAFQPCFILETVTIETILAFGYEHPLSCSLIQRMKDAGYYIAKWQLVSN